MTEVNWEKEYKELAQKYEDLLEDLPQWKFSKAGTPPAWVIKEVENNTLLKLDVQDDIKDILKRKELYEYSFEDVVKEISDYLEITE